MVLLLAVLAQGATTGLQWRLEEPVRYHLTARVELPDLLWIQGEQNLEARVSEVRVQVDTTCRPESERGRTVLACALDEVTLAGTGISAPAGSVEAILTEWDERLTGAIFEVRLSEDGRIRGMALGPVPMQGDNQRTSRIRQTMAQVLERAFALLDLELPRKGEDRGKDWKQGQSTVLAFVSEVGTMGAIDLRHRVTHDEGGGIVAITSEGRGTLGSAEMIAVGGQERPANLYEMTLSGTARFDTGRGILVERTYVASGTPTSSSVSSETHAGGAYVQTARLTLLGDDGS